MLFEIRAVCLVDRLEVAEVREKDCCLNDVIKGQALGSQKRCYVIHYSPGLRRNVAGNDLARLRVEWNLAATKQETSAAHSLRIGTNCRRRFIGGNGLLHVADCNWKAEIQQLQIPFNSCAAMDGSRASVRGCPRVGLLHSDSPRRDGNCAIHGWVAQSAEQWTENPRVAGSIPAPAILK